MRVGVFERNDSGIERILVYTLENGEVTVDKPESTIHYNMMTRGLSVKGERVYPKDGEVFLKALIQVYNGSYMWAIALSKDDE